MNIEHIGYAVADLERAVAEFCSLGYRICGDKTTDPQRRVAIQFVENNGVRVELIAPEGENSPIAGILARCGNAPYHICYRADDIDADIRRLVALGYKLIEAPSSAPACAGRRVAFLFKAPVGIIELMER